MTKSVQILLPARQKQSFLKISRSTDFIPHIFLIFIWTVSYADTVGPKFYIESFNGGDSTVYAIHADIVNGVVEEFRFYENWS